MNSITIARPDDWHLHLRDGAVLAAVLPHTARRFARAIVMPNLAPPVTNVRDALSYRGRILYALGALVQSGALPKGTEFNPLMTLYLTDRTSPDDIRRAVESRLIYAVKYYPAGATTNSDSGVTSLERAFPALETMQDLDLPLLVHGEVTGEDIDVFDREHEFLDRVLAVIVGRFPGLRVVMEHITTREAAQFVLEAGPKVAATVTAHHLLYNRNALFQRGLRPHHYCLPVFKREEHRRALVEAATGDNPKFFLGTDSAPHPRASKEHPCGCAGIYSAHAALELYAEVFESVNALNRLEAFASHRGADFYRLPRNAGSVTLVKSSWEVPVEYPLGDETVVPLRAGEMLDWQLV